MRRGLCLLLVVGTLGTSAAARGQPESVLVSVTGVGQEAFESPVASVAGTHPDELELRLGDSRTLVIHGLGPRELATSRFRSVSVQPHRRPDGTSLTIILRDDQDTPVVTLGIRSRPPTPIGPWKLLSIQPRSVTLENAQGQSLLADLGTPLRQTWEGHLWEFRLLSTAVAAPADPQLSDDAPASRCSFLWQRLD